MTMHNHPDDRPEPVTAATGGNRLNRTPATIRKWGQRYGARQLGRAGRETVYDYRDLATIDGCIHRGEPIPPTPETRDELRAQRRAAALTPAA
ncbi:hypothetical protein [Microbispora corallina]|uniref:hypothetical protein n=1 Tax=Microbispora corallina TaxID=83302 RepID=UPI0019513696|nr:hypothetical protein [Microbispora corallina]